MENQENHKKEGGPYCCKVVILMTPLKYLDW